MAPASPPYTYQRLPTATSIRLLQIQKIQGFFFPCAYQRLPGATSIRLLQIRRIQGFFFSRHKISITISTWSRVDAPPFDALSYTWGNPMVPYSTRYDLQHDDKPSVRIDVDEGHSILVTKSLADALLHIRDKAADLDRPATGYLWADGICINQGDLAELSEQVTQMDEIYKRARKVIVWLGHADEFTDDAVTLMERVSRFPLERVVELTRADYHDPIPAFQRLDGGEPVDSKHWLGLIVFFDRPWFKRAWILQEAILARTIVVLCETRIIPWSLVAATLGFLQTSTWMDTMVLDFFRDDEDIGHLGRHYRNLLESDIKLHISSGAINLRRLRSAIEEEDGQLLPFSLLLEWSRAAYAKKPADKIYALLGLARKDFVPFTTHPGQLVPDYSIPACVVYTRVTRMILEGYRDLEYLEHAQNDVSETKLCGLPSWVPDYSADPSRLDWCKFYAPGEVTFTACGDMVWRFELGQTPLEQPELAVNGFLFDTVAEVTNPDLSTTSMAEARKMLAEIFTLAQKASFWQRACTQSKSRFEILWRTVLIDMYEGQQPAPDDCGRVFIEYMATTLGFLSKAEDNGVTELLEAMLGVLNADAYDSQIPVFDGVPKLELFNKYLAEPKEYWPGYLSMDRELSYTQRRRYMLTSDGRFCLGPMSAQPGDAIWIIGGFKCPTVLRRDPTGDETRYTFVGRVYIHGSMHGEAVSEPHLGHKSIVLV